MMNDVLTLITIVGEKRNADGYPIGNLEETEDISCEVVSVKGSEFYDAMRAGVKATVIFRVNPDDYDTAIIEITKGKQKRRVRPTKVRFEDEEYAIIREYKTSAHRMELTCERVE